MNIAKTLCFAQHYASQWIPHFGSNFKKGIKIVVLLAFVSFIPQCILCLSFSRSHYPDKLNKPLHCRKARPGRGSVRGSPGKWKETPRPFLLPTAADFSRGAKQTEIGAGGLQNLRGQGAPASWPPRQVVSASERAAVSRRCWESLPAARAWEREQVSHRRRGAGRGGRPEGSPSQASRLFLSFSESGIYSGIC